MYVSCSSSWLVYLLKSARLQSLARVLSSLFMLWITFRIACRMRHNICDTFSSMSAQSLSGSCLSFFKEQLPLQQFNSWIKPLIFEIDGDKLVLTAPNSFTLRIVQERFLPEISKRALPFFSAPPQIEFRIEKRSSKSTTKAESKVV